MATIGAFVGSLLAFIVLIAELSLILTVTDSLVAVLVVGAVFWSCVAVTALRPAQEDVHSQVPEY